MKNLSVIIIGLTFCFNAFCQNEMHLTANVEKQIRISGRPTIEEGQKLVIIGFRRSPSDSYMYYFIALYDNKTYLLSSGDISHLKFDPPDSSKDAWDILKIKSDIIDNLYSSGYQYDIRHELEREAIEYIRYYEENNLLFEDSYIKDYLQNLLYEVHPIVLDDGRPGSLNIRIYFDTNPNAFILANGSIFVSTGLIGLAENEEELIGALAHEIAHFVLDHHIININKQNQRQAMAEFWSGVATLTAAVVEVYLAAEYDYMPTGVLTYATAAASTAIAYSIAERAGLKYSWKQEMEADNAAKEILNYMGIEPSSFATLLSKIRKHCYLTGQTIALTSIGTHPSLKSRIQALGFPNTENTSDIDYDRKISRILTANAVMEYNVGHYTSCEEYVDRNIDAGVATEMDFLLKGMVIRTLFNTPEHNEKALAYIQKAKTLNVNPKIIVHKQEGITLMRLNRYEEAKEAFINYENALLELQEESRWIEEEYSWTRDMLHKVRAM